MNPIKPLQQIVTASTVGRVTQIQFNQYLRNGLVYAGTPNERLKRDAFVLLQTFIATGLSKPEHRLLFLSKTGRGTFVDHALIVDEEDKIVSDMYSDYAVLNMDRKMYLTFIDRKRAKFTVITDQSLESLTDEETWNIPIRFKEEDME